MLVLIPLCLMLLGPGPTAAAEPVEVELEVAGTELVLGEPLQATATVRNTGNGPLTLLRGGETGFRVRFAVERTDGLSWDGCHVERRGRPHFTTEQVPAGWERSFTRNLRCLDEPGEYRLSCSVESRLPQPGQQIEGDAAAGDPWIGRVVCDAVTVRVTEPIAVDRKAFEAFAGDPLAHRDELIERFPTSIYAGHAILRSGPWRLDPVAEIEVRGSYMRSAGDDPVAQEQMARREEEQRALSQQRVLLLEGYLAARPEFVHADFMRLELATRLAYLGEYERARAICATLAKKPDRTYAVVRAVELLTYLDSL